MPLYHFQVEDGTPRGDHEDVDLPNLEAARSHATRCFNALVSNGETKLGDGDTWRMHVTDEAGLVCFSLQFAAVGTAAGGINAYRERAEQAFPRLGSMR